MQIPQEILDRYGIKRTEIIFVNRKKVIIRYYEANENIRENVSSIDVEDAAGISTIAVHSSDENGDSSITSAVKNIKEIIVVD